MSGFCGELRTQSFREDVVLLSWGYRVGERGTLNKPPGEAVAASGGRQTPVFGDSRALRGTSGLPGPQVRLRPVWAASPCAIKGLQHRGERGPRAGSRGTCRGLSRGTGEEEDPWGGPRYPGPGPETCEVCSQGPFARIFTCLPENSVTLPSLSHRPRRATPARGLGVPSG